MQTEKNTRQKENSFASNSADTDRNGVSPRSGIERQFLQTVHAHLRHRREKNANQNVCQSTHHVLFESVPSQPTHSDASG